MTQQVLAYDWSNTALGPLSGWPESLRIPVQLLLQSRHPMYLAWGPELISIYNDSNIPILGDKHPQALGKPYRELWAEVADQLDPLVTSIWAGQSQYYEDLAVPVAGRAGRPMGWFTFSWTPLRDQSGQVQGFLSIATETTNRVLEAEKLMKVMSLMENMERITHTGSWEADLVSGSVVCSAGLLQIFGLDPAGSALTLARWHELIHPEETKLKATCLEQLLALEAASFFLSEYRIITPSGETRWLSSYVIHSFEECKQEKIVRGITVDLTQRKSMELGRKNLTELFIENERIMETLRAQQRQLEIILEAANLGVWELNLKNHLVNADARTYQILGDHQKSYEFACDGLLNRIHPEDFEVATKAFEDHLHGVTEKYEVEQRMRHANGHWIWLLINGRIIVRSNEGQPLVVAGTVQDITKRKQQSQQGVALLEQIKLLIKEMGQGQKNVDSDLGSVKILNQLTKRQRQLLELIAKGWTTARIAGELGISTATAVTHRRSLMRKLNLHNTAEVTKFAIRCRIISDK